MLHLNHQHITVLGECVADAFTAPDPSAQLDALPDLLGTRRGPAMGGPTAVGERRLAQTSPETVAP
ncbi:hypothetical protein OG607_24670 [Streptomyces sp. NBC_01537]|uniref:hypothetical protein n=1 Tax=Streptomyces sp. NBC_01537 TaxID=2903896 RepID=UPI00386D1AE3